MIRSTDSVFGAGSDVRVRRKRRRGAMWPLMLAILGLMLAGLALAVDASLLWQARQELQVAADASALAAIQRVADDHWLTHRPGERADALYASRRTAQWYASQHHALGRPVLLEPDNPTHPDVLFGFYDSASQFLQLITRDEWDSPYTNSVEVIARRTRERGNPAGLFFSRLFHLPAADVSASATAVLDRQVVGFRPQGNLTAPIIPIALLSDPAGLVDQSWESQVDKPLSYGGGVDRFIFDKAAKKWASTDESGGSGDGLPEFTLTIALGPAQDDSTDNGKLVHLGRADTRTWLRQVTGGISASDLLNLDGELALAWDGICPVSQGPLPVGQQLIELVEKLKAFQATGEARAWPLYQPGVPVKDSTAQETEAGVAIRGFVAARIAEVFVDRDHTALVVILQPAVLVSGTAITQPTAEVNPYLAKARLLK